MAISEVNADPKDLNETTKSWWQRLWKCEVIAYFAYLTLLVPGSTIIAEYFGAMVLNQIQNTWYALS